MSSPIPVEISGWDQWQRQSGSLARPEPAAGVERHGTGLTARYYQGSKGVLETVEAPIYFEPFGPEPHADQVTPACKVVWSGFIRPPVSDRFQFRSLLGTGEQAAVWIDGRIVHAAGLAQRVDRAIDLAAGHRHRICVEYINPDGRAELKLLWSSRIVDPARLSSDVLYPEP
jgi:hypothetical protein